MFPYINQEKVALRLSEEEGAMYAATEYGLCGVPLVTTRNKGGRVESLYSDYVHILETDFPTAKNVAEAVEYTAKQNFSPSIIRNSTIYVLEQHRNRFKELILNIYTESQEEVGEHFKKLLNFLTNSDLDADCGPFLNILGE